jgi:hypothetical protein
MDDKNEKDSNIGIKLGKALENIPGLMETAAKGVYQKEIASNKQKNLPEPASIWTLTRPSKLYRLLSTQYAELGDMSWFFGIAEKEAIAAITQGRDAAIAETQI